MIESLSLPYIKKVNHKTIPIPITWRYSLCYSKQSQQCWQCCLIENVLTKILSYFSKPIHHLFLDKYHAWIGIKTYIRLKLICACYTYICADTYVYIFTHEITSVYASVSECEKLIYLRHCGLMSLFKVLFHQNGISHTTWHHPQSHYTVNGLTNLWSNLIIGRLTHIRNKYQF